MEPDKEVKPENKTIPSLKMELYSWPVTCLFAWNNATFPEMSNMLLSGPYRGPTWNEGWVELHLDLER